MSFTWISVSTQALIVDLSKEKKKEKLKSLVDFCIFVALFIKAAESEIELIKT